MARGNKPDRNRRREGVGGTALVGLGLLLVLPAVALSRLAVWIDWRVLVGVPIVLSIGSFFVYRSDKRRAEAGERRIPESNLHVADLLGGWPGGFLAQRIFRHKTAKGGFQAMFWLVVLSHEYVAADALLGWRLTREVFGFLRALLA